MAAQVVPGDSRRERPPRLTAVLHDAAAIRSQAAAWVTRQVSRSAVVACDPGMCSALLARGIPAGNLLDLRAGAPDPLGSDVVVATAAVRSQFGGRLASVYAPGILATFGSGGLRIEVRAVAPDGAAAYRAALASDLEARREAARLLLGNPRLRVSPAAGAGAAGRPGGPTPAHHAGRSRRHRPRAGHRLRRRWPRRGPGHAAEVGGDNRALAAALGPLRHMLAFVRAQRPPYLAARSLIAPRAGGSPS